MAPRAVFFDSRRWDGLYFISSSTKADLDRLQQAGKPREKCFQLVARRNSNLNTIQDNINPRQRLKNRKVQPGYKVL